MTADNDTDIAAIVTGAPPAVETLIGGVMIVIGLLLTFGQGALVIGVLNIGLVLGGIAAIVDGLRRKANRAVFEDQARRILESEDALLAELAEAVDAGENPAKFLQDEGFTELTLRQYLLGRHKGRIEPGLAAHLRRRRR